MAYLFDVILIGDVLDKVLECGFEGEYEAGYTHVFIKSNGKSLAAAACCAVGEVFYVCCLGTIN